ncbi:MAG: hypothetical protein A2509_07685 [Candidatus Edwardsbacteria bacterium RIFOXYD12_FULL_50_11]|uniref:Biopolymer transporter ExbD n=1 Tax=Candidatus Edwardsbacteria bacterium GWF2_54_11 TaxID=1817851 RepID=A0A1F5RFT8_9BACT|nr:MAG: hypothetical protein A2502_12430 [Candidatus Edwardsbacteria bacterium RifOxyC12_full_54_24]OGF06552.1 MAG: hypothetical protein A2273_11725 [Candidatus Edwardsbacteria bacterium RifOxyA12_full_54_48]OGF12772.1 MAG: hypothetical protein A3K15_00110 [Candidatus Edwardsbacteria bacterium GWE2_54_12]OGF13289.1 MAG: hypothetical protein A2024_04675 [Candidatus Edwardsbacteria bacterium GWF2_54_11]OGF17870.1 MAG: hypothetical protein A2509_07685 [Candidatus Edwardsbacteria bacterium RIFOXYD1
MGPQESGKKKGGLRKRKGRPNIVLDMTPMVDIGFLLVIFFMTTTRFKEPQAIEITLPPETAKEESMDVAQSNVLSVNIMKDGTILQNIGFDVPALVAVESLDSLMLNSKLANIKKMPAHIDGRTQVYYESGPDFLDKYGKFMADNKGKRIPREIRDSLDMVRDEKICRLTVLVQVNRESSYDKVVAVMDAIQQNQIARFAIVEQTEDHLKAIEEAKKKAAATAKGGK